MNKHLETTEKVFESLSEAIEVLRPVNGRTSWTFEKLTEYVDGLFSFSQFNLEDEVILNSQWEPHFQKELDKCSNHGWKHCKHFLIEGAVGQVKDIDYRDGKFVYDVVFDNESWVTSFGKEEGKLHPVSRDKRHIFCIWEDHLESTGTHNE